MKRDGNICKLCGKPTDETDFTIDDNGHFLAGPTHPSSDHIIPLEKGGEHTYENAQLAHFLCNAKKGAKIEVSA